MKVVFQQADLDTCLTALLLCVSQSDEIIYRRGEATQDELANPENVCIEAGGSGEVHLNNFDHHNTSVLLPPACVQAHQLKGGDVQTRRLVEYVAHIDQNPTRLSPIAGLTLSALFSGMRIAIGDPREQLLRGITLLQTMLTDGIDPFGPMPEHQDWQQYIDAKEEHRRGLDEVKDKAKIFTSRGGLTIGYVETIFIGALGTLYEIGCHVGIAFHPRFGNPPVPKHTIGGNNIRVDTLLPALTILERGWGGPVSGTILGSPRVGSCLTPEQLIAIVEEIL